MIVTDPWVSAVASPVEPPIVAICVLLEDQATWLVILTVAPVDVVPIAMNCVVALGIATDCEAGSMVSEVTLPLALPVPVDAPTVTVELDVMLPVKPFKVAVIVAVPAVSAVTRPAELTLATAGEVEVHVAKSVTFDVVEG
jgi:hypothetical protein